MHMTDLEERLAAPDGAALRESLLKQLAGIDERLRLQMRSSLPRDEFATCESVSEAVQAAIQVLLAWPVHGPNHATVQFPSPLLRRMP